LEINPIFYAIGWITHAINLISCVIVLISNKFEPISSVIELVSHAIESISYAINLISYEIDSNSYAQAGEASAATALAILGTRNRVRLRDFLTSLSVARGKYFAG
jgi:methyl-accepting chemotaxis protein